MKRLLKNISVILALSMIVNILSIPSLASASIKSVTDTDTGCNIGIEYGTRVDEGDVYGQKIYRFYVPRTMNMTFTLNSTINDSYFYKLALYDSDSSMIFINLNYSSDDENASIYHEYLKGEWKRDVVSETATFTYSVKLTKGYYYFLIGKSELLKNDTFFQDSFGVQYPTDYLDCNYKITASYTINKGKTAAFNSLVAYTKSSDKVTWSSSNKSIVTVNSKGTITAKKSGTAKITVKVNGYFDYTFTVKVK